MATAIDNNVINQLGLSERTATRKPNDKLGQEEFLKLMTTQINNQDPMKPMENGEFLGQIAQFASVSGIQEMQASLKNLVDSLSSNQAMQASALVGKTVVVPASQAYYDGARPLRGGVEIDGAADNVIVGIFDQSGQLVSKLELGPQASGTVDFEWDGRADDGSALPAGTYQLKAESVTAGNAVALTTLVADGVEAVSMAGAGKPMSLTLTGGASVGMSDIIKIM